MSETRGLSVRRDTVASLKAMSHSMRRQASAIAELAQAVQESEDKSSLGRAGKAAGMQARELESLAGHLKIIEGYLDPQV